MVVLSPIPTGMPSSCTATLDSAGTFGLNHTAMKLRRCDMGTMMTVSRPCLSVVKVLLCPHLVEARSFGNCLPVWAFRVNHNQRRTTLRRWKIFVMPGSHAGRFVTYSAT